MTTFCKIPLPDFLHPHIIQVWDLLADPDRDDEDDAIIRALFPNMEFDEDTLNQFDIETGECEDSIGGLDQIIHMLGVHHPSHLEDGLIVTWASTDGHSGGVRAWPNKIEWVNLQTVMESLEPLE